MFPSGTEMKYIINGTNLSKLNDIIENEARFGNLSIDMGPTLLTMVNYTSETKKLLITHGYDVQTYYTNYKTKSGKHKVVSWDNNTVVDIPGSVLITATHLRKSRQSELILELIENDFKYLSLRLNEFLHKNIQNSIVQNCIKTVCTYGYSYNKTTNQFTPI